MAQTLPFLLLSIPLGLLADRRSRRLLMVWAEVLRTAALLILFVATWSSQLSIGVAGVRRIHRCDRHCRIQRGGAVSVLAAATMVATLLLPWQALAAFSFFLFGIGPIIWTITSTTLRQTVVPSAMLGFIVQAAIIFGSPFRALERLPTAAG